MSSSPPPPEFEDSEDSLTSKIDQLVALIQESKAMLVMTGAGISTVSGIPDYRGTGGLYNAKLPLVAIAQFERENLEWVEPSFSHHFCSKLFRAGKSLGVITSNHDGLHNKCAAENETVIDLFGNVYVEKCLSCDAKFTRETITPNLGRVCARCGARVVKTGTRMGAATPQDALEASESLARLCDLVLVLGSSMTISPFCNIPWLSKSAKVVLVTLQETSFDSQAALCIHAKCDVVTTRVSSRVFPQWSPEPRVPSQRLIVTTSEGVVEVRHAKEGETATCLSSVGLVSSAGEVTHEAQSLMAGNFRLEIPVSAKGPLVLALTLAKGLGSKRVDVVVPMGEETYLLCDLKHQAISHLVEK